MNKLAIFSGICRVLSLKDATTCTVGVVVGLLVVVSGCRIPWQTSQRATNPDFNRLVNSATDAQDSQSDQDTEPEGRLVSERSHRSPLPTERVMPGRRVRLARPSSVDEMESLPEEIEFDIEAGDELAERTNDRASASVADIRVRGEDAPDVIPPGNRGPAERGVRMRFSDDETWEVPVSHEVPLPKEPESEVDDLRLEIPRVKRMPVPGGGSMRSPEVPSFGEGQGHLDEAVLNELESQLESGITEEQRQLILKKLRLAKLLLNPKDDAANASDDRQDAELASMPSPEEPKARSLSVMNLAFCTEVESFGVVTKFPRYEFRPNQQVLLYCELENFLSSRVADGYQTQLQGKYTILNEQGSVAFESALPKDTDLCAHKRRDFYCTYLLHIPKNLRPGQYRLRLQIEDLQSGLTGSSEIHFRQLD